MFDFEPDTTDQLENISQTDYQRQMAQPDAVALAAVPGLHSKVWLSNPHANSYGGFYLWQTQGHMQAFMAADLVKTVPFATIPALHAATVVVPADLPTLEFQTGWRPRHPHGA